jgi:hypothetical protein
MKDTVYLIRQGAKVTFPIKPTPIRIEGTIKRVRVEVQGTDHRIYLVDPSDVLLVDKEGVICFANGSDNLNNI